MSNNNVSAVRLGDKLIIFVNGKRQVISQSMSPEIFDNVCGYIEKNDTDKIVGLFDNFEHNLSSYIKDFFVLEEGVVKDTFHNENHHFSKIIIRKASEIMSKNLDVKPLFNMSKKLFYASENISNEADILFNQLSVIGLTKEGNLLLPLSTKGTQEEAKKGVIGNPISIQDNTRTKSVSRTYSLGLHKKTNAEEVFAYALVSPFDIVGFQPNAINVTRYRIYSKGDFDNLKGIIEIQNEKLFDIAYTIYEKNNKKD